MKLRAKLSGLITAVLLVSLGGCGGMAVTGLLRTNVRLMAENEREKLEIAGRGFCGKMARTPPTGRWWTSCFPERMASS